MPYKCLITLDKVRSHPKLGRIIDENPDLFSETKGERGDTNTFLLFFLYEHQLGEASFWKPWLDVMPEVT